MSIDVTVYGAGIFGLSVAWACLQRGVSVQVIDPNGVAAGSSGGIVGALAPHTPENWNDKKQFQFDSLAMAETYWTEIAQICGLDPGYARLGRLQPVLDARGLDLAKSRATNAETLWQGFAKWSIVDAEGAWTPETPTGRLIFDTLSARIHPRQACTALAAAIKRKGCTIKAEGISQGVKVYATGYAGLLDISAKLDQPVGNGVKGQALLIDHDARGLPQLFADSLHFIPHADGTTAIGSTSERDWTDLNTDTQLDAIHARAIAAVPALRDAKVIAKWAGIRPRAKSRAPMIGRHPSVDHAFIANGGFKIGFGMAPKVGAVLADLILTGRDAIPDSFKPQASLR